MKEYRVIWEMEVSAKSPEDAAEQARIAQVDPDTLATIFEVTEIGAIKIIEVDPR